MGRIDLSDASDTAYVNGKVVLCSDVKKAFSNGAYLQTKYASVEKTLTGASVTATGLIPAGTRLLGISTYTTTAITGASGYTVGDGSTADLWGDVTGTAVGTKTGAADYKATGDAGAGLGYKKTAGDVVLTAKTSNFTGGKVRILVAYEEQGDLAG